jgi:predicted Zn-dependent protease
MSPPLRHRTLFTLLATFALALPAGAQQANVQLPNLGSSADTMMSPQQAQAYGAEFLRELRAAHLVLDDPQVDQYLHALGYRLAAASADPKQKYTFTAINIPEINAFATFGGYIFLFSDMITMTQNQDQLAAVIAHELAHISQHHLQRAMEDQKKSAPLYMLGAIAAGLAASQLDSGGSRYGNVSPYGYGYGNGPYSGGDDNAMGAFIAVMAAMQQHQIDFTRHDEEEADHVGIATLAKAGFDPEGMATVFARMQSIMRPGGSGGMAAGNLPDFLQDHPVTSVRIADARARARTLKAQMHPINACVSVQAGISHCEAQPLGALGGTTADPLGSSLLPLPFVKGGVATLGASSRGPREAQYELMRERVRVLSANNARAVLDYYTRNMAGSRAFADQPSNQYGYALALIQTGQGAQALPVMRKLADAEPGSLTLALGVADAERHAGQSAAALKRFAGLNAVWPNDPAIVLEYSRALLDAGGKTNARSAQALLKPLLDDDSEPSLYSAYGHACLAAGDEVHAGIAYADATFLSGHAADALDQLHRLLKRKDLDYYTRAQIDSRIDQITPIVLEIRRRHLDRDGTNSMNSTTVQGAAAPAAGRHLQACVRGVCTLP